MLHRSSYTLLSLFVIAVLLLGIWQPARAQESPATPEPQGLRPDAPTYGVHGPHPVGARDMSIATGDHAVDITIWYPALNPDNASEVITYTIGAGVPDMAGLPIGGNAIADADPDTAHGPYPLVVFSPGLAGWRQANSYLLEHLASYGFVVIAADPRGETFTEFWEGAGTRPVDTRDVIDYADTLTAAGGAMAGLIDTDRIAVAGHSSGGWTALVGGGAQMDLGWCDANPKIVAENELSNCTQFVPHADDIAAILGLESTPSGMWPPTNDPRVKAVVALAPDGDIWGADYEGVAALQVPTLVMAGTGDTVNIPERCAYPIYEHLGSAKKSLITFANGDHMIFFNQCRDTPWMVPDLFWACADAVWDMDRAHDMINHFATAFLLAELKGDADAAAALAPENVAFPGIQYETTAYDQSADVLSGFVENDGVRIHYEVEGQGPPLVLMHWWSGSLEDWRLFGYVDALKDQHRLVLIDARGHGQSDKPHDPAAYGLERQAGDVVAVLDELGIDQADYFGYSMGGTIGWALAKYAPDRLSSLIIGGEAPENYDPSGDIESMREAGPEGWGQWVADVTGSFGFTQPEIYTNYAAIDTDALIADVTTYSADNFAPDLPAMTMPILLLAGTDDEDHAALQAAAKNLPNAQFASLPGFDHLVTFLQTELVMEPLTQFLDKAETAAMDDATIAEIETLVEGILANGQVPGAAVGIIKDGELVYAKGFGVAELGSGEPVTPETVFVMMSIAKSGVGMAIMQLVEEGKIELDAPVTEYVPYFALAGHDVQGITIRRLLSHTAGVPSSIDFLTAYRDENKRTDDDALEDFVRSLSDQPPAFQPGAQWDYSDAGFDLLADVVAKVSGQSFEDYMQEHILTPLGMEDSSYLLSDMNPVKLATPYIYDENGQAMEPDFFPYTRIHAPSGGLLSNVNDMARFAIANMNHGEFDGTRVLQAATYDEMWAPQADSTWAEGFGPQVTSYALGWWVGEFNGHTIIGNYGADAGFQSHLGMFPDEDFAVIAMVNLHDPEAGSFLAYDIGNAVAEVLLDGE